MQMDPSVCARAGDDKPRVQHNGGVLRGGAVFAGNCGRN